MIITNINSSFKHCNISFNCIDPDKSSKSQHYRKKR